MIHFLNNDTPTKGRFYQGEIGRYTYQREIHLPKGDTFSVIHFRIGDTLFE